MTSLKEKCVLVVFKNLILKISQESITSKLFINNGLPHLIFTTCELPGVSTLICFNDFIVMSLSKGMWESAHVQWGCQREHGQWVPSFAFSAQSSAGFPAFPGRRDIVAMAISEAGSSWRGCVCQGIQHGREVVAKGWGTFTEQNEGNSVTIGALCGFCIFSEFRFFHGLWPFSPPWTRDRKQSGNNC